MSCLQRVCTYEVRGSAWSSLDGFNVNLLAGLKADVRVRAIAMGLDDEAVRLACERHCLVVGQCSVPIHPQLPIDLWMIIQPHSKTVHYHVNHTCSRDLTSRNHHLLLIC